MWTDEDGFVYISGKNFGGEWVINGSVVDFTNWDESYPSSTGNNKCIAQNSEATYRWKDVSCDETLHHICEVVP
jgi:hypothetical protein